MLFATPCLQAARVGPAEDSNLAEDSEASCFAEEEGEDSQEAMGGGAASLWCSELFPCDVPGRGEGFEVFPSPTSKLKPGGCDAGAAGGGSAAAAEGGALAELGGPVPPGFDPELAEMLRCVLLPPLPPPRPCAAAAAGASAAGLRGREAGLRPRCWLPSRRCWAAVLLTWQTGVVWV